VVFYRFKTKIVETLNGLRRLVAARLVVFDGVQCAEGLGVVFAVVGR
jgi:hypothetical protein